MEKKLYQSLAIISIILAGLSGFLIDWTLEWFLPLVFFGASFWLVLAARNPKYAFFLVVALLPFLTYFNSIKFNVLAFLSTLRIPPLYVNLSALLYLSLCLLTLISIFCSRKKIKEIPLAYWIIVLIVFSFLSVLWSIYPQMTLQQTMLFSFPLTIFIGTFYIIKTKEDFFALILVITLSSLPAILIGTYQIAKGQLFYEFDSPLGRVPGPFYHPNNFGLFLFFIVSAGILVLSYVQNRTSRSDFNFKKFSRLYFFLPVLFLVLTFSRTSWIAVILVAIAINIKKIRAMLISLLVIALIVGALSLFEKPREKITGMFQNNLYSSLYAREEIFKIGAKKFLEKPILGYGIGTFEEVIRSEKENYDSSSFPHNDLILFFLEGGMVGGGLFIAYNLALLVYLVRFWRKTRDEEVDFSLVGKNSFNPRSLGLGILIIFLAFGIAGITEATTRQAASEMLLFLILGGYMALVQNDSSVRKH